jgi:uncharacterized protein YndB with AHSA1/START domain
MEHWWITLSKDDRPGYAYGKQEGARGHVGEFGGRAVEVVPAEQLQAILDAFRDPVTAENAPAKIFELQSRLVRLIRLEERIKRWLTEQEE